MLRAGQDEKSQDSLTAGGGAGRRMALAGSMVMAHAPSKAPHRSSILSTIQAGRRQSQRLSFTPRHPAAPP